MPGILHQPQTPPATQLRHRGLASRPRHSVRRLPRQAMHSLRCADQPRRTPLARVVVRRRSRKNPSALQDRRPQRPPGLIHKRRPGRADSSGGSTETRRDRPSASASLAALITAARAQPPPIQPSEIVPSGKITALAPALAAVAATVRTTVASTNGSPAALRDEMIPRISDAFFIASFPCEIGL